MYKDLFRFENIGNNCEFGFFLKENGLEDGNLFRWAFIHDYQKFIDLILNDFRDFYAYENLYPTYEDMVTDKKYNMAYHTQMTSHQEGDKWVWDFNDDKNRSIYKDEMKKRLYLVKKFKKSLRDDNRIFVLKQNDLPILSIGYEVAKTIKQYGSAKLLCIENTCMEAQQGQVKQLSDNLYVGFIDRFAPYDKSNELSDIWHVLIKNSLAQLDA